MKLMYIVFALTILLASLSYAIVNAQNPIVQRNYTADPAPMVYNDKVYLYTTHYEDESTWFTMNDWKLYTTEDMVNWTDHGTILSYTDFSWAKKNAWAGQCIERDGKFYIYVPITTKENKGAIGVAVANSPYGPFIDPLGKQLISNSNDDIDPSVFIDDDGQVYLFWGNPVCYYVQLNEDMISYQGEIAQFPNTVESFGKRDGNPQRPTSYEEGPWQYKRNDLYYLIFAAGPIPEHIGYSTGNIYTGPWKYRGVVMPTQGRSFTNHPGIIEAENFDLGYPGNTYFDKDEINAGGKYRKNQPVDIDTCLGRTYLIGWTNAGEWLAYTVSVCKSAIYQVSLYLATIYETAKLHLEIDGSNLTNSVSVPNTAGFQNWTVVKKTVKLDSGQHVLKLDMDNGGFNIDKMVFKENNDK